MIRSINYFDLCPELHKNQSSAACGQESAGKIPAAVEIPESKLRPHNSLTQIFLKITACL
jgi:hypothetical protein